MDKRDYDYDLPAACIAQQPLAERSASRLLVLARNAGAWRDCMITDLADWLDPGDLLVFNDTRVLAARLHGTKTSGGRVEIMLERVIDQRRLTARIGANKPPRPGSRVAIGDALLTVARRDGEFYTLVIEGDTRVETLLARHGHMPLPPYIRRADTLADRDRYQSLWARRDGAVAAPTASLHFDRALLDRLTEHGVVFDTVTLHVGSGTYQRLRETELREQRLHAERVEVGPALCRHIAAVRARGNRVIAVGTTVVRSLETAARASADPRLPDAFSGETTLFVQPGDVFHAVDGMVTNFHEPRSSLLMLVSAFAGRQRVLDAYAHAVAAGYRFLSYGDAMLVI